LALKNRRRIHWLLTTITTAAASFNFFLFPVALKTQPNPGWPSWVRDLLGNFQQQVWWLWPVVTLLMLLAKYVDKKYCDRWGFDAVKEMLELLRERAFPDNQDPQHFHRVTLFRYRRWRLCLRLWPWSGWLIPIVRSGYTTQRRKTSFLAPEDDPDKAEGIAGRTWSSGTVILIPDASKNEPSLPALNKVGRKPTDIRPLADAYGKATFVTIDWTLRNMPDARSFMGIPVMVKGEPWGVIVVDSRDERITDPTTISEAYNLISRPFIKCIERLQ
jgi:hypothetical protein